MVFVIILVVVLVSVPLLLLAEDRIRARRRARAAEAATRQSQTAESSTAPDQTAEPSAQTDQTAEHSKRPARTGEHSKRPARTGEPSKRRTVEPNARGSNRIVAVAFVFVTLGLGIALPLVILHGNHANASDQVGGVKLTADSKSGRMLFGEHCAVCHTLAAANAIGKVGPDLDTLKPPAAEVLHVIENGCLPNVTVSDENEACLGQGVMPAQVVTGQDARDVASFVAQAAGH